MKRRALYTWSIVAYYAYLTLPFARNLRSRYGRFMLWLLAWAGMYAYSNDYEDFCRLTWPTAADHQRITR